MNEPSIAADYDDRGTRAAHAVLVELGQVLGAHRDAIVVVGGAVPSLLMNGLGHIGTLDIDLDLDPEKLTDHGYADLVEKLQSAGYQRDLEGMKPFQLRRTVDLRDGGVPVAVIVDLLMPKGAKTQKHRPPLIQGLRVQEVDGGAVALWHHIMLLIEGTMPDGRLNRVEMLVASIPALLVMKGYALVQRDKKKDAYDIYFSVRNFAGGPLVLAETCKPLLADESVVTGYRNIASKFRHADDFGPQTVKAFLAESDALGEMSAEQVQVDAFMQVRTWLRALGMMKD